MRNRRGSAKTLAIPTQVKKRGRRAPPRKKRTSTRILGVDPGYHRLGYTIIDASVNHAPQVVTSGTIETEKDDPFPARLNFLFNRLTEIIDEYMPEELAVEQIFHSKNVKTAILVAHARGAIILAGERKDVRITEYQPRIVKLELHGNGNATKDQIRYVVNQLLRFPQDESIRDDEYDAIAIALTHAKALGLSLTGS